MMNDEGPQGIAEIVRRLRLERGLSQQRLADKAGVSQTTIDKIEQGSIKRPRYLPEIAKALGVAVFIIDPSSRHIEAAQPEGIKNNQVAATSLFRENYQNLLPVFASFLLSENVEEDLLRSGLFVVGTTPLRMAERPNIIGTDIDAYGIYMSEASMAPEFELGDIMIMSPAMPISRDTSCIFFGSLPGTPDDAEAAMVGRLLDQDEKYWKIQKWSPNHTRNLEKSVFKRVHRVALRQIR